MKKILFIVFILIIFLLGINVGSENDKTKADIIQDKINDYESGKNNGSITQETINPNILNKIATKCNDTVEAVVKKVLKSIIK
ncbi:MAG: hypothetical protein SOU07_01710 [Bacilli bacterium]|nr:hypothetical protein [Acholeplasmataceae bacterium]MDY2902145.1 hypothetical protein [Bacilli bacterium]